MLAQIIEFFLDEVHMCANEMNMLMHVRTCMNEGAVCLALMGEE